MPYAKVTSIDPAVRKVLPLAAQHTYMAAFNSAEESGKPEPVCHKIAWAAVGNKYTKSEDGIWRAKESATMEHPADHPAWKTERVVEWFPAGAVETLGEGDFRIEFLAQGLTQDGKRYYPKRVTEAASVAGVFDGAKMFLNHRDSAADARRGHRDLRDWGATIKEGTVRAVEGNLQAICHAHTADALAILNDPVAKASVGLSHDSFVKLSAGKIDGKTVQIVESIDRCNSVDLVPAGNAKGRVIETLPDEEVPKMALEDLTMEQLREARPDLVEALETAAVKEAKPVAPPAAKVEEKPADPKTGEDRRVLETLVADNETKEARIVRLEETLKQRDIDSAVRAEVDALPKLAAVSKARIVDSLAGRIEKLEDVAVRVKEAAVAEEGYVKTLLRESGVQTRVTGAGQTDTDASKQVKEAYEAAYKSRCEEAGIPYTPVV